MRIQLKVDVELGHPKGEAHARAAFAEFVSTLPARVAGLTVLPEDIADEQVLQREERVPKSAGARSGNGKRSEGNGAGV